MSMIPLPEYARLHNRSIVTAFVKVRQGVYPSARKVGGYWYIDENEPWEGVKPSLRGKTQNQSSENGIDGKITLSEYSKRYGLNRQLVYLSCKNGLLKSAEKIGKHWFVDANEPYLYRRQQRSISQKPGKISIKEYCARHHLNRICVNQRCKDGDFKSAEKIDGVWFFDENERYIDKRIKHGKYVKNKRRKKLEEQRAEAEAKGKISLNEYSKRYHFPYQTIYRKCKRGDYKTREKIGTKWYIDENEPYIDMRMFNGRHRKTNEDK